MDTMPKVCCLLLCVFSILLFTGCGQLSRMTAEISTEEPLIIDLTSDPDLADFNPYLYSEFQNLSAKNIQLTVEVPSELALLGNNTKLIDEKLALKLEMLKKELLILMIERPKPALKDDIKTIREAIEIAKDYLKSSDKRSDQESNSQKKEHKLKEFGYEPARILILAMLAPSHPRANEILLRLFNAVPVAVAGIDLQCNVNATLTLDGSATDADNDPLTFTWSAPEGIMLSDPHAISPTIVASALPGLYILKLSVTDGYVSSVADEVCITVINPNHPPIADAGADFTAFTGALVTLKGSGSDQDNDALTYTWTAPDSILLSDIHSINPNFTAPSQVGTYVFGLTVSDGQSTSAMSSVAITVLSANKPPVVSAGSDLSVSAGSRVYFYDASAYDPEGKPVTATWYSPDGIFISNAKSTRMYIISPYIPGTYELFLYASDGETTAVDSLLLFVN